MARNRAKRILETGEDPLYSTPYFYQLMLAADYPEELIELSYLDDDYIFVHNPEEKQKRAREALEELLPPELRQKRLLRESSCGTVRGTDQRRVALCVELGSSFASY